MSRYYRKPKDVSGRIGKGKSKVGQQVDYRRRFDALQRDMKGLSDDQRRDYLKDFYKQIAKAADQRLVNLESLSKKQGYREVTQWAYRQAMRDIRAEWGEDARRFNRKIPDNFNSIYKDINRVLNFLESPTSSKQGIDEIYSKRAQTINERYGVNVSWSNVGDIFNSILYEKVSRQYGSKTALKAIATIQANKKDVIKALKGGKPISVHITDDPGTGKTDGSLTVEETANKFLRYYKKDVKRLLERI
jgi:hypothetical protein